MPVKKMKTIACLGTGTMGHGIAFLAAKSGCAVRLFGRSQESVRRGLDNIDRAIKLYEDNELMPRGMGDKAKANITGFTGMEEAVSGVDMVMESVAEDMRVKHGVYQVAEKHCPDDAILATNTSSLTLSEIAKVLKKPERFCAAHFSFPPYLMPTVEVCPCPATLPSVVDACAAWVESMGNVPIVMNKEVPGFLFNRLQAACVREAAYIVEQGWASPETVDKAIVHSLGRRYSVTGPLVSADMGGLDIFDAILDELGDKLCRGKSPRLLKDLVKQGNLGMKSGQGIYAWPPEAREEQRGRRERALIAFIRQDHEEKAQEKKAQEKKVR